MICFTKSGMVGTRLIVSFDVEEAFEILDAAFDQAGYLLRYRYRSLGGGPKHPEQELDWFENLGTDFSWLLKDDRWDRDPIHHLSDIWRLSFWSRKLYYISPHFRVSNWICFFSNTMIKLYLENLLHPAPLAHRNKWDKKEAIVMRRTNAEL
ncbi:unnamed protein product [Fusarium venenatum]|uniref:Uncharacterized protein n=1 Tax=Fusarium venenatum TaxID=56646 RepID=A0A2L2TSR5_9HYPO|nr:LOW QUALITY PROTEIN: uncharacterized protein FVRRES_09418 [Fusarium venenatum]CEI69341.1 unnamed protein product [Fusarium venenatum]